MEQYVEPWKAFRTPGRHVKTIVKAKFSGGGHGIIEGHRYDHPEGMYGHRKEIIERIRERCGANTKISFTHLEEVEFEVYEDGTWRELCRTVL